MIIYVLSCMLLILMTIVAYIFNPIVALFANEYGNLPKWLYWFDTYDNPIGDIDWWVKETVRPKFMRYNFDKHYIYHPEQKGEEGKEIKGYVEIKDGKFTFWDKVQRWYCRTRWLYRNCCYGLRDELGFTYNSDDIKVVKNRHEYNNDFFVSYEKGKKWYNRHFCVWIYKQWCRWFCLRVYLGWKMKYVVPDGKRYKNSISLFIGPFRLANRK